MLKRYGVRYELLDRDGCIRHEPALARVRDKFVGGLLLPGDETGDCFKFTQTAGRDGRARGAKFRYGTSIEPLVTGGKRITGVVTDGGRCRPMPTWSRSAATRRCCWRRWASASRSTRSRATRSPCRSPTPAGAPESTVMDETHKVAVTRLGDRIRVGGTAELAGYTLQLHEARRRTLEHVVTDLFPAGATVAAPNSGAACGR